MTAKLLNTTQAAEYLGTTTGTLEVWRSAKRYNIPYIKVGRLVRYRLSDLDDFIRSRTIASEG
jgi:excisionase family DNA binding protein